MKCFVAVVTVLATTIINLFSIGVMRYLAVTQPLYVSVTVELVVGLIVFCGTAVAAGIVLGCLFPEDKGQRSLPPHIR